MDADRIVAKAIGLHVPSQALFYFLQAWEGPPHYYPREDPCAPGVYDIGYGHVCAKNHPAITQADAELILMSDMEECAAGVRREVVMQLTQYQFDALVSFAFNVGLDEDADYIAEGLGDSTLLKYIECGQFAIAAAQFSHWDKAGGRVVVGLQKRRAAEYEMFTHGDYSRRP